MQQSLVHELPVAIEKLDKLRHLLAYYHDCNVDCSLASSIGLKIQGRVGCLKSLQMMLYMDTNHGKVELIKELGKLRQLRHLGLTNLTRGIGRALCGSIKKMNNLEFLDVSLISEEEIIDLNHISSSPQRLQKLYIKGCLDKLPNWIPKLQHLVCVNILWSRLSEDPLKIFENLPNFSEVRIAHEAYNGKKLHFKEGEFTKLKELELRYLRYLNQLNVLIIDKGSLPLLEELSIGPNPQLKEVPFRIRFLGNLKELSFIGMTKEFEEILDLNQGTHYWIIVHVPVIYLLHKIGKGYYNYDNCILCPKHLERSKGCTIKQDKDDKKEDVDY